MEQELKQRLIGVTILVALVVIFVPMLFDERQDRSGSAEGIPPIPSSVVETQLELPKSAEDVAPKEEKPAAESGFHYVPLNDPPAAKPGQGGDAAEALESGEGEEDFAPASTKQPEKSAEKSGLIEEPRKTEAAPAVAGKPGKPASADRKPKPVAGEAPARKAEPADAAKKPKPAKPPEPASAPVRSTEAEPRAGGAVAEIKPKPKPAVAPPAPGPAPVRPPAPAPAAHPLPAAADAAAATPAKPAAPKPVTAKQAAPTAPVKPEPAKPEAESPGADVWVIQAGSFSSEEKARALAEKLRQSRFPAFIEAATSDHGPTFRVQIGPELDRSRAEQMQKQMESSVGIRGIIVPHP